MAYQCTRCSRRTPIDYCSRGPCPMVPVEPRRWWPALRAVLVVGAVVAWLGVLIGASLGEPAPDHAMTFTSVEDGRIAARGYVTPDTADAFTQFLKGRGNQQGTVLVLQSGGGSVLASMDVGRIARRKGMHTTVEEAGECASMCVFALLGGVRRSLPADAKVLVHQIWPGGKRKGAEDASYSAEELVRIQRDLARMARYTVEMGGDLELLDVAARVPPWEPLRSLSSGELRRMRVVTE